MVGRDLVARIFRAYETGKPDQLRKTLGARVFRASLGRPLDDGLADNMGIALTRRKIDIALQIHFNGVESKSGGAAQSKVSVHRIAQHDDTSGQAMAISRSNPTSTLA